VTSTAAILLVRRLFVDRLRPLPAAAREHDTADDGDDEQRGRELERPEEVGEETAGQRLHVAGARRVERTAGRLGAGDPVAPGQHDHLHEQQRAEDDRRGSLEADGVVEGFVLVDAEQRDDEQEQHDDRARVDDDLDDGDELRVLLEEEHGHRDQRQQQEQRVVHRVAREHHTEGADERERGTDHEDDRVHQCESSGGASGWGSEWPWSSAFCAGGGVATPRPSSPDHCTRPS
jgi:hypothetical protein